ncbi:MAG: bifunctional (p)ppGpp synthetase/guanosine-3',5'-bis(diphosphate) 3'-pyrophosphohydrolase [Candidatus Schekmanbacteria bacterium]|nr:bifunctional (p)ppGpp synthetase/guanosine-3',5'-bis(diphosphate) 3'-pyrophosphohydrolase [Candidatus Schekmanbacteria bacterium]
MSDEPGPSVALSEPQVAALLEKILNSMREYCGPAGLQLVVRAAEVALAAHRGQTRQSGEAYCIHPLEVARILSSYGLDPPTIAAAILHDTMEDTALTRQDVADKFGEEITRLVEGVTKLSKLGFRSLEEHQAENLRKMVLAMAKDIRVILIKLADRIHNMRTLGFLPTAKRRRIAKETMDIYAPLASRLGIDEFKCELEDLAFRYSHPDEYAEVERLVKHGEAERRKHLEECAAVIKARLVEMGVDADIHVRMKHLYSVWQKMQRNEIPFEEVYDLAGIRLVTKVQKDCYAALGVIHTLWRPVPGRLKDFIALPKPNMYQSIHTTVFALRGHPLEIQIRTSEMHRTAEIGVAAHWRYKEGGEVSSEDYEKKFAWLRQLLEWQREVEDPREFMEAMKLDLFGEEVYVFTPAGEVKALSRGATPVDFAYAVHTEIGNRCVGAKVNGKLVPLRTELRNGNIVEILTKPGAVPKHEWLKFVKSSRARNQIKLYLKQEAQRQAVVLGEILFRREMARLGQNAEAVTRDKNSTELLKQGGFSQWTQVFSALGVGKIEPEHVTRWLGWDDLVAPSGDGNAGNGASETPAREREETPRIEAQVRIHGALEPGLRFAKCCSPVPGDAIVGIITRGRGVSIHTANCPNAQDLDYDPDRRVEVEWDITQAETYAVKITVHGADRPGLFAETTAAISRLKINILTGKMEVIDGNKFMGYFVIEIPDADKLEEVISALEKVQGVTAVERAFSG